MTEEPKKEGRTWSEEIEVTGSDLVERVKQLIQEGNVRKIIIRRATGEVLLEIPLTAGIAVTALVTLMAPVLAGLGAMAALLTEVKIEVVRSDTTK